MANKLKKVFSNEEVAFNGKIHFKDQQSYEEFLEALKTVQKEGKVIKVPGVVSIETAAQGGSSLYPLEEHEQVIDLAVGPSVEHVSHKLNTEFGENVLNLVRYHIEDGIVLETFEKEIIYLKMVVKNRISENGAMTCKFTYRLQPEHAKNIREVVETSSTLLAFCDTFFSQQSGTKVDTYQTEERSSIKQLRDCFVKVNSIAKKLDYLEKELEIVFDPAKLTSDRESEMDLEELYLVLKEKKVIRLNGKLTATEDTQMTISQPVGNVKIGSVLDITFLSDIKYTLWGYNITLYTSNLLSNAIVKEIKKTENDETKIIYGDEDSRPMYISYRGFKTEDEAREEVKNIMNHKNVYVEARMTSDYINDINTAILHSNKDE